MIIAAQFDPITHDRLNQAQYVGWLGQQYHVATQMPDSLRLAADHVRDQALALWLRRCAAHEQGFDRLIRQDLDTLHATILAPTAKTRLLLEGGRLIAASDRAYRILGLVAFWDQQSQTVSQIQRSLPKNLCAANRFLQASRSCEPDRIPDAHGFIQRLPDEQQGEIRQQMHEFVSLYTAFHRIAVSFESSTASLAETTDTQG